MGGRTRRCQLGTGFFTRGGAVVVRREGLMIMEGSGVVVKALPSWGYVVEGGIVAYCLVVVEFEWVTSVL